MRLKYEQTASNGIKETECRGSGATHEDSGFDWPDSFNPPDDVMRPVTHIQDYKASVRGLLSPFATPCEKKTITGIQQLQIALKFPILSL